MANDELVKLKNEYTNIKSKMESMDVSLKSLIRLERKTKVSSGGIKCNASDLLASDKSSTFPLQSTSVDEAEIVVPSPEDY